MVFKSSFVLAAAAAVVQAQQSAYGQCGGVGWTGATTCVSGYYCSTQNSYYSQCIPGTGPASPTTTAKASTTLKTTTKAATSTNPASTGSSGTTGLKNIISFGDSYSQTGFDPTSTLPNPSDPLGNPTFPGYTTTDGKNWLGYYITSYNTSLVYDYNFAYGGATTDSSIVTPYEPTVLSFVDQIGQFEASLAKKPATAPWTSDNTLFAVWMGVNDVGNAWYESNWTSILSEIMTQYFNQTQYLYNAGARKFLFLTVPPIYETPNVIAQGATVQAGEKTAIAQYNAALQSSAASFAGKNSGIKYWVLNTTTPFQTALDNPTKYGAPDATCYNGDGVSCLWFNDVSEFFQISWRPWLLSGIKCNRGLTRDAVSPRPGDSQPRGAGYEYSSG